MEGNGKGKSSAKRGRGGPKAKRGKTWHQRELKSMGLVKSSARLDKLAEERRSREQDEGAKKAEDDARRARAFVELLRWAVDKFDQLDHDEKFIPQIQSALEKVGCPRSNPLYTIWHTPITQESIAREPTTQDLLSHKLERVVREKAAFMRVLAECHKGTKSIQQLFGDLRRLKEADVQSLTADEIQLESAWETKVALLTQKDLLKQRDQCLVQAIRAVKPLVEAYKASGKNHQARCAFLESWADDAMTDFAVLLEAAARRLEPAREAVHTADRESGEERTFRALRKSREAQRDQKSGGSRNRSRTQLLGLLRSEEFRKVLANNRAYGPHNCAAWIVAAFCGRKPLSKAKNPHLYETVRNAHKKYAPSLLVSS